MSAAELLAQPLSQPVARLLTLTLAHFLWQGLALAVLLAALVELCNIRRAAARYACSLAALLTMIACPLATLAWLGYQTTPFHPALTATPTDFSADPSSASAWIGSPLLATWIEVGQPYLLAAWLVGVVLFGSRLLGGALGVVQLRRGRQSLPDKLKPIVEQLGQRLHMNAMPLVFLSRQVTEAMAVGIVRPLVLIPAAWASEMPLDLLEAVIAHELAHLRRRDLWVNLLQRIVETVLFYHPAVWWLSRRLRIERELCADELAIAATGKRLAYAQALEQVAHQQQADIRPALAAFLRGEKDMRLLQRVRNVLRPAKDDRSRLWPAGLVALALPLGLWLASVSAPVALADDEREGDRPVEEQKFERRFETRRDSDRPRKEVVRDGEGPRKPGSRDGEGPRKPGPRDGEAGKYKPRYEEVIVQEIDGKTGRALERRTVRRDGEAVLGIEVERNLDGEGQRIAELTALVKRLSAQVEKLQDEVTSLRARTSADGRDQSLREWRETYDKHTKGAASDKEEAAAREKYFRLREGTEKVIAEKAKAVAQQERAIAEKAAALAQENAQQFQFFFKNEEIQELVERKQAEAKKAAEGAIRRKLEAREREKPDEVTEAELDRLKLKLRDDQALLLDRERKPAPTKKPIPEEKPLKEKPLDQ